MVLRYFLFLSAAYIVFHKIFPFRRNRVYSTGAAPPRQALVRAVDRPRLWRDRDRGWISIDFDIGKKGDHYNRGPLGRELHFVAAVLALRFLDPLEASLWFPTSSTNQPTRFRDRMGRRGRSCRRASAMRGLAVQMHRQLRRRCTR